MEQQVKKEVTLTDAVVELLMTNKAELDKLQTQMNEINLALSNVLTGICLNAGVDPKKETIRVSEDMKTLLVYDNPTQEGTSKSEESVKQTKIRKLK